MKNLIDLKERCHNCDHYQVAMDKTIYPAPGIRGVWVEGCVERKIRFGNFAEVAAGKGKFPEYCESFKDSDIANARVNSAAEGSPATERSES